MARDNDWFFKEKRGQPPTHSVALLENPVHIHGRWRDLALWANRLLTNPPSKKLHIRCSLLSARVVGPVVGPVLKRWPACIQINPDTAHLDSHSTNLNSFSPREALQSIIIHSKSTSISLAALWDLRTNTSSFSAAQTWVSVQSSPFPPSLCASFFPV